MIDAVSVHYTGKRGRPSKTVDPTILREATDPSRRITTTELAEIFGIHRHTLRKELKKHHLDLSFSQIDNSELDAEVQDYLMKHPDSGQRYVQGELRQRGLRIQRARIRSSIKRVDRLGHMLRKQKQKPIQRRRYYVSRPNALWHIDGHHKLIHWGIVIHGCVDGFSRLVCLIYSR